MAPMAPDELAKLKLSELNDKASAGLVQIIDRVHLHELGASANLPCSWMAVFGECRGGKSGNCALREELRALTGLRQVPVVFDVRAGRQVSASAHMCTHVSERAHRVPRCQRADTRARRRVPARRAWQDPVGGLAALVKHLEEANAAVEMGGMAGAAARLASGPSIGGVRL